MNTDLDNPYSTGSGSYLENTYGDSGTTTGNPTTQDQRVMEAEQKAKFDWGSVFGFGSSLLGNSGQLASVFSPKYREDKIALANAQSQGSWTQRNLGSNGENNNTLIFAVVAIIVVVVLIVFLTKKKDK